jgi:hypothetical protein
MTENNVAIVNEVTTVSPVEISENMVEVDTEQTPPLTKRALKRKLKEEKWLERKSQMKENRKEERKAKKQKRQELWEQGLQLPMILIWWLFSC